MAGILFWVVNFFLRNERLFKFDRLKFSMCLKSGNDFLREGDPPRRFCGLEPLCKPSTSSTDPRVYP